MSNDDDRQPTTAELIYRISQQTLQPTASRRPQRSWNTLNHNNNNNGSDLNEVTGDVPAAMSFDSAAADGRGGDHDDDGDYDHGKDDDGTVAEANDSDSNNNNHHDGDEEEGSEVDSDEEMPPHACEYCSRHDPLCVARCLTCKRWFCNGGDRTAGSHIITHLAYAKHNSISLHPDGPLGDAPVECYVCGQKNVFSLGFVPSTQDNVVVVLCREPCLHSTTLGDMGWDASTWLPLIEERHLLHWLCAKPRGAAPRGARSDVTNKVARELESGWASAANKVGGTNAVQGDAESAQPLEPIPLVFRDPEMYTELFNVLTRREMCTSQVLSESIVYDNLSVTFSTGLDKRQMATVEAPLEGKLHVGGRVSFTNSQLPEWTATGLIVRVGASSNLQDELHCEIHDGHAVVAALGALATSTSSTFTMRCAFNNTSFERMLKATSKLVRDEQSVSSYLFHAIMGHEGYALPTAKARPDEVKLPASLNVPHIAPLNDSQDIAVRMSLKQSLTLIQGPPGTGKTTTSATIIYHFVNLLKSNVLVCSPSNIAVDQLAVRVEETGLRVVRLAARSREPIASEASHLMLHEQVRQYAAAEPKLSELRKLMELQNVTGDLSDRDRRRRKVLEEAVERSILEKADVVCTTCASSGDPRLKGLTFRHVLVDEATQATEPETLIPLVLGAKQVVLVGDHCQLGPVLMNKDAQAAGLGRSLFERLLQLGHVPHRLTVQYRMHPILSEFSSNNFYDGTLQNGVSAKHRDSSSKFPWPNPDKPMIFYNSIAPEELSSTGTSYINRAEAALAEKFVSVLVQQGVEPRDIGIIVPYEGQRNFIIQYLSRQGSLATAQYRDMEIASVDAFQGREKEFIIFSFVRSNDQQGIGFLKDWRRLNVAITRARRGLFMIGNARVLSRDVLLHSLLAHLQKQQLIVEGPVRELAPTRIALQRPRLTLGAIVQQQQQGSIPMMMMMPWDDPTQNTMMYDGQRRVLPDYQTHFGFMGTDDTSSVAGSAMVPQEAYFDVQYNVGMQGPLRPQRTMGGGGGGVGGPYMVGGSSMSSAHSQDWASM